MRPRPPRIAPAAATRQHRTPWLVAIVALAGLAWYRALGTGFAQDDFHFLGLAARHATFDPLALRPLSTRLYFGTLHALFGLAPLPFHLVNVALLAATACLAFLALARRVPTWAAGLAMGACVTSPVAFDAVHWASAAADLWCAAWLAAAVLVLDRPKSPARLWLAAVAFLAAVESKEVAVGVAPVLVAWMWRRDGPRAALPALLVVAGSALAMVQAMRAFATGAGGAYALAPGALGTNLAGYLAALPFAPTAWRFASDLEWARQPAVAFAGAAVAIAAVAGLVRARSADLTLAAALVAGALAPVLLLGHQFYFYYAVVAAAAFWGTLALGIGRLRGLQRTLAAAFVVAAIAANGAAVQRRGQARLDLAPLPVDFVQRRAALATNVLADVRAQASALRPRVIFVGQQAVRAAIDRPPSQRDAGPPVDPYWDHDVRAAIADGEAVRLVNPGVRDVVFARTVRREDSDCAIASYTIDGHVTLTSFAGYAGVPEAGGATTVEACLRRAGSYLERHMGEMAVDELRRALAIEPRNATVLLDLGTVAASLGDTTAAIDALRRALDVAPTDADAQFNLGLLLWRRGDAPGARTAWSAILRHAPDSPNARAIRDLTNPPAH